MRRPGSGLATGFCLIVTWPALGSLRFARTGSVRISDRHISGEGVPLEPVEGEQLAFMTLHSGRCRPRPGRAGPSWGKLGRASNWSSRMPRSIGRRRRH